MRHCPVQDVYDRQHKVYREVQKKIDFKSHRIIQHGKHQSIEIYRVLYSPYNVSAIALFTQCSHPAILFTSATHYQTALVQLSNASI